MCRSHALRTSLLLGVLCLAFLLSGYAQGEDLPALYLPLVEHVGSPLSLSPTGTFVASATLTPTATTTATPTSTPVDVSAEQIAFVDGDRVCVLTVDTLEQRCLYRGDMSVWDVAWSADGAKMAFAAGGIWVMAADGSQSVQLTNEGREPAWSPDGSKIAFSSARDGGWDIYMMNSDGSDQTRLTYGVDY